MKKFLFLFAALCCMMVANAQYFKVDGIKYQKTSDKAVKVVDNDSKYSGDVVIPAKVTNSEDQMNYDVTSIGDNAFENCKDLTSITIPETVTSIGDNAFGSCNSLMTITFADGSQLSKIGDNVFKNCTGLTSITIPESVESIGVEAFLGCSSLATVTFAEGSQLSKIGESAFAGCSELTSITIPETVTSIGDNAFQNCTGLTSITIPETVTSIGSYTFDTCSELETVTFAEGSQLSEIGESAFYDCGLTSITIPETVTTIGESAFSGCSYLTSVTVFWTEEEMLPELGDDVFAGIGDDIGDDPTLLVPFGTKALYENADVWKDFGKITESFGLKVSSGGWASMYLHCAVKISKYFNDDVNRGISVSVYYASEVDGNTITLSEVKATTTITQEEEEIIIIPAKTGVIVKVEVDGEVDYKEYEVNFAKSDEAGSIDGTNLFEGVLTDTEKTEPVYVLSGASAAGNPQFQEYSGSKLNAFKAYLPMSAVGSGAKEISVVFGETTSIQEASPISSPKGKDVMYDLNGMRVNPSTGSGQAYKGIVIKNGKKMFNK